MHTSLRLQTLVVVIVMQAVWSASNYCIVAAGCIAYYLQYHVPFPLLLHNLAHRSKDLMPVAANIHQLIVNKQ